MPAAAEKSFLRHRKADPEWRCGTDSALRAVDDGLVRRNLGFVTDLWGTPSVTATQPFYESGAIYYACRHIQKHPMLQQRGISRARPPPPRAGAMVSRQRPVAFHGAYCAAWAHGAGFVEALAEAARIASDSCRFHGTRAWMQKQGTAFRSHKAGL